MNCGKFKKLRRRIKEILIISVLIDVEYCKIIKIKKKLANFVLLV